MEWMLQVVDEIDDAVALMRHSWLGLHAHIGVLAGALYAAVSAAATVPVGIMLRNRSSKLRARI